MDSKILLLLSIIFLASTVSSEEFTYDLDQDTSNWSDPWDMFTYDSRTKTNVESGQDSMKTGDQSKCECPPQTQDSGPIKESNCEPILDKLQICRKEHKMLSDLTKSSSCSERIVTFVSRSVRKLVLKLKKFEQQLTDEEKITISSDVNPKNIQLIDQFASQIKPDCNRVDEFEEAFYEVIDNMDFVNRPNLFLHFFDNYSFYFLVILSLLLSLLFLYKFYFMSIHAKLVTSYTLVVLISFIWEWIQLYQKAVSDKHYTMSSAPKECIEIKNDKAFSFTSIFFSYIKTVDKECKDYYRALMVNPVFEVNPLMAGSHALSTALFAPISIFLDKLGEGFSGFYSHFSFMEKVIVSGALSIILIILLIFLMGYSIHLPFFLGSIVRGPQRPHIGNDFHRTNSFAIRQRLEEIDELPERERLMRHRFRRAVARNQVNISGVLSARDLYPNYMNGLSRSRSLPSLV